MGFLIVIDLAIVEPLAYVVEKSSLDKPIKIVSLVLLIVGFAFDMLSS
jgi:exoribonuclease II